MSDRRVWNSTRFLLKLPEHTWGLDYELDLIHWPNEEFHKLRDGITSSIIAFNQTQFNNCFFTSFSC